LIQSKTLRSYKGEIYQIFFPFIAIILVYIDLKMVPVALLLMLRLLLYNKQFFLIAFFLGVGVLIMLHEEKPSLSDQRTFEGIVVSTEYNREYPRLTLKSEGKNYLVFDERLNYQIGDYIWVEGEQNYPLENGFFGGFDYGEYLRSINIESIIYVDTHALNTNQPFNIHRLRGNVHSYIKNTFEESGYLKAFILASRDEMDEISYDSFQRLGIAHLFAVSGLHIGFLVVCLKKGISLFSKRPIINDIFIASFLLGYLFLTNYPPSVLRASLMVFLLGINKHFKLSFSTLDCVLFLCMMLLIIHPFYIHQTGFILSFLISITLILSKDILNHNSKITQAFMVSFVAFLVSVPVVLSMQGAINLSSVLINVLFVGLMSIIILPLTYIVFMLPFLEPIYSAMIQAFESLAIFFLRFGSLPLSFYIPNGLFTFLYIGFVYYALSSQSLTLRLKRIGVVVIYVLGIMVFPYINPTQSLTMYDVRGDSFLLRDRFNQCNMLIDVGDKDPNHNLVNALKRKNITYIDYVLISHKHMDHYGGYEGLNQQMRIGKTITNYTMEEKVNQWHRCGNIMFYMFENPTYYANENDNSMIVYIQFMEYSMLFTGDIELPREIEFMQQFSKEVDILKIAHHGSITSSYEPLIQSLNPEIVLVPAHRNNTFDHPSDIVINRVESIATSVYRLDHHGSVKIQKLGPFIWKKTAISP